MNVVFSNKGSFLWPTILAHHDYTITLSRLERCTNMFIPQAQVIQCFELLLITYFEGFCKH